MDPDTIKRLIAVVDERVRVNVEHLRSITAAVKEDQHLKENFVAKLKQAEDELSRKPARKRKR